MRLWEEIAADIKKSKKFSDTLYSEVVNYVSSYNPIPADDIHLAARVLIDKSAEDKNKNFCPFYRVTQNIILLLQNPEFLDFSLQRGWVDALLRVAFASEKEKIARILINKFEKEGIFPIRFLDYHIIRYLARKCKKKRNYIMLFLKTLAEDKDISKRICNKAFPMAELFSSFPADLLPEVYEIVKDSSLCRFLLANKHITHEMKMKALRCNAQYRFKYEAEIKKEDLLSLTPTQLWNFLNSLFRIATLSKRKLKVVESNFNIELPSDDDIRTLLLPIIVKEDKADLFSKRFNRYKALADKFKSSQKQNNN